MNIFTRKGVHRSLVSKLPDELPIKYSDRATGAAIRLGRVVPRLVAGSWRLVNYSDVNVASAALPERGEGTYEPHLSATWGW